MVSGLVTSPCDQLRIFSGDARLMRIASKSAITFAISKGLERNKVFLRFLRFSRVRRRTPESSSQFSVLSSQKTEIELSPCMRHQGPMPQRSVFQNLSKIALSSRPQLSRN